MTLRTLHLWRLRLPLQEPYRLTFGLQHAFECVVVLVEDRHGHQGWGEAAFLPGYSEETADGAWPKAEALARACAGHSLQEAEARALTLQPRDPFLASAFLCAMEMLHRPAPYQRAGRIRLLGTLNAAAPGRALEEEIEGFLRQGYATLKVKVGWSVGKDLEKVHAIADQVGARARLRLDANQGYSEGEAIEFVEGLAKRGLEPSIELFEQPCAAADWDAAVAVHARATVPMMLDEAIFGMAEIDRAAALGCAAFVKLKLMKMGSLAALERGLERIKEQGMKPVLGNGVASDLTCWQEALAHLAHVETDGEQNGFAKLKTPLGPKPLETDGPWLVVDPHHPLPEPTALDAQAQLRLTVTA